MSELLEIYVFSRTDIPVCIIKNYLINRLLNKNSDSKNNNLMFRLNPNTFDKKLIMQQAHLLNREVYNELIICLEQGLRSSDIEVLS